MNRRIILFEDHTVARFQPLAAGVPLTELRCGLFCLRDRVNLLGGGGGGLAVRRGLARLVTDPSWAPLTAAGGDGALWLSGRLAPDPSLVEALVAAARLGDFALADGAGPLALAAGSPLAAQVAASWLAWAGGSGTWTDPKPWLPPLPADWEEREIDSMRWLRPAASGALPPANLAPALGWIWDIVPRTAGAITADLAAALSGPFRRRPYGLLPATAAEPAWRRDGRLAPATAAALARVTVLGEQGVFLGEDVDLMPGTVIDTRPGPVVLDSGVGIGAHVFLEGPLYLGPTCRVKAGACLYGESSYGVGCRVAGEIGESSFGDFSNKQHEGFIGHAVLGSWVNLGALTTCSDLKNNYGTVRVDLGRGQIDTGLQFVGLLMGDHAKTAIGTLFNTGTCVGFAANVFGEGMPPKFVPPFSWGGRPGDAVYAVDKAAATGAVVMGRRGCAFGEGHGDLFRELASL